MTVGRTIDYEALSQEAMRGVIRTILVDVAKHGLPGDHHFYISFDTRAPGVLLSKRLLEKYPEEMTIVLQHRFWDLAVTSDMMEVKLTFDGIPERLVIPFTAVRVFFDPSVRYGLQFETAADDQGGEGSGGVGRSLVVQIDPDTERSRGGMRKARSPRKPRIEKSQPPAVQPMGGRQPSERANGGPLTDQSIGRSAQGAPAAMVPPGGRKPGRPNLAPVPDGNGAEETARPVAKEPPSRNDAGPAPPPAAAPAQTTGAQVVNLDAFRKK